MVVAIIQARMGSTRLPGKSSHLLAGISILEHIINRLQEVLEIDRIQLATTQAKTETPLIEIAKNLNIPVFQGSEDNLLKRFIDCAKFYKLNTVIRLTADCPLIDPYLVKDFFNYQLNKNLDYWKNKKYPYNYHHQWK